MHVLVVEDDPQVRRILQRGLESHGHAVTAAADGEEALWAATENRLDAIVLDVEIGDPDGVEVCRRLRARDVWTPILMLTGRTALGDRVAGLDAGADDYLAKPFEIDEVLARLRAILRRAPAPRPTALEAGGIRLDPATAAVTRDGTPVELSPKALAILEVFLRHPGQVLRRGAILEHAWGSGAHPDSNVVDVYVRQLRAALDRPFGRASFATVRGIGYRLDPDA
ncbi:MAG: response regulator transcription factor [Acidimicrobiia bacterium]